MLRTTFVLALCLACVAAPAEQKSPSTGGGNRLAYLDEVNPYYPHKDFAKLITPQWVGEEGVEAVVILSIDDMRDTARYENYLRPILDRLKKVGNSDGLSRMSIFTNAVNPKDEQLQKWLKEGVSFEVHTITHPCPCLGVPKGATGDIEKAKQTYDGCVDMLFDIPNYKGPVAYRMPCCDSMNSVSPRFFAEVMNKTTKKGNFLSIDSSVFNIFTSDDPALPRELVQNKDGSERFAPYAAFPGFVNTIENYPYPYVIGNMIWEFPCVVPSDWEAQHRQGVNNPKTVEDLKAAIDCTVIKQGTFTLVFHPHGWIKAEQIVELIDHAEKTHGRKVKFLSFREAMDRLNKHLLEGGALRDEKGSPTNLFVFDAGALKDGELVSADGMIDVIERVDKDDTRANGRLWIPATRTWNRVRYPLAALLLEKSDRQMSLFYADLNGDGEMDSLFSNGDRISIALRRNGTFKGGVIIKNQERTNLPPEKQIPPFVRADGTNNGFFIKGDALYWQNEDTGAKEPHHVKKITFAEVLAMGEPGRAAPDASDVPEAPNTPNDSGAARPGSQDQSKFTTAHRTPPPLLSPEASLPSIKVRPGFRVELVAAEPLTMDPVAFDWGPDGKLWIVEMADYPSGLDGNGKPGGRVVYLEDTDDDGKYDRRTIFLDGVPFPTGVMVWKKGVLVTAAPDVFYAEDTDGDGKADKREVLFTGFGEGNQQHRVNGLRWGLDGWIYLGNGDSGGNIRNVKTGETVSVNGRDLRIRQKPDGSWEMDAQSGQTQFGRERDDFGNWFGCNNPNPGWHYALEDHYLRRNPHVAPPNPRVDLTSDRRVFPISTVFSPSIENHRKMPGDPANHSSANSICIYRDDLYGEHFYGNAFVSEPVHNLIRRMVLRREGVSFRAERAPGEETSDFLASSDPCFRPNMIRTGPDGCLWFADMYRQTIEHPKWIPPAWQATLNLREGDDKGRIYRIVEVRAKPRAALRMDKLDAKGLVAAMDSSNGWQRDMAQMMLTWSPPRIEDENLLAEIDALELEILIPPRHDPAFAKTGAKLSEHRSKLPLASELTRALRSTTNPSVKAQLIWVMYSYGTLEPDHLKRALTDSHAGVRRVALQVVAAMGNEWTPSVADSSKVLPVERIRRDEDVVKAILGTARDPDPAVRQQLAYAIDSSIPERRLGGAGKAISELLLRSTNDPYVAAPALSPSAVHLPEVFDALLTAPGDMSARADLIDKLVAIAVATDRVIALNDVLLRLLVIEDETLQAWRLKSLATLFDALAAKKITLDSLRQSASPKVIAAIDRLPELVTKVNAAVADRTLSPELRTAAISLFFRLGDDDRLKTFASVLVDLQSPPAVQEAAASAMAKLNTDAARSQLLAGWSAYSPSLRAVIMDELLRSDRGAAALVSALEAQVITRHEIDAARRQPLLTHKSEAIRSRAEKLLGGPVTSNRQALVERYERALALAGDATRGAQVFTKNCAACHKLGDTGTAVGPDLARINDRSGQALVTAVLDPNRAVEAKYVNYLLAMNDGEKFTGIITTETGTSITIIGIDGKARTVLRKDLESLRSLGLSLMPDGLEQAIDEQAMADLVAFVAGHGQPRKTFENNTPRTIKADDKGTLTLPAAAAEVFGPSIIFEQQYRNLGYWSSDQDHAVWTVEVTKGGKYEVTLNYALASETKTNVFQLLIADQKLSGPVPATGSWDKYVTKAVGTIELNPGTHRLTFRSQGPVKGALIDLRTIVMKPTE